MRATGRPLRGRLIRRIAEIVAAAWVLAACAFPFGSSPSGDSSSEPLTPRERNNLYLREQEQQLRRRQGPSFDLNIQDR
jgi:hypothetical protein